MPAVSASPGHANAGSFGGRRCLWGGASGGGRGRLTVLGRRCAPLGGAIAYLRKHWAKLTLFLRVPGVPLDNNLCEGALKKAILHRKNALFHKTLRGVRVGDIFVSLIHTCELCGDNPFDYLTELERHAEELSSRPQDWMPWNYRETPAGSTTPSSAIS